MRVDLFDFELPETRIALTPAAPRDSARMLVVGENLSEQQNSQDKFIRDLPDFLHAGDVLVVNNTRVIPARLTGFRRRGDAIAQIEVTLHKREGAETWRAFVKPAKKLKIGEKVHFGAESSVCFADDLFAEVLENFEGEVLFQFCFSGAVLDEAIERLGHMPLPPYIASKRAPGETDSRDYQTLFAQNPGAVAAPTAGLHFTPELVERIKAKGVSLHQVTLHVGAGTFLPVKVEDTADHKMHSEFGIVTREVADALNAARARGGRIVAVGTTSMRILESASTEGGHVQAFAGDTAIFITPGYVFRAVDVLLTNFHLPRSTLFMLVSAFAGLDRIKAAYAHAIASNYRFYSYGDACLLYKA